MRENGLSLRLTNKEYRKEGRKERKCRKEVRKEGYDRIRGKRGMIEINEK